MNNPIDKLLTEWAYRVHDGMPDISDNYHLVQLEQYLNELRLPREAVKRVLEKVRKYKDNKMNQDLGRVGEPWGSDAEDVSKRGASDKDVDSFSDDELTSIQKSQDEIPKLKKFTNDTVNKIKKTIDQLDKIIDDESNEGVKKATIALRDGMEKFMNAKTHEERTDAVKGMVENGLLSRNQAGGKGYRKVYISSNASGVPYKQLMGSGNGNVVTQEISDIIDAEGLAVDMRNSSADRSFADLSGKHNEAGVVALLDPSDENKKNYEEMRKKYKELGGSDADAHKQNEAAAKLVTDSLPEGSTVTGAVQTGGMGKAELLARYGIDTKVDPTDFIVYYTDADGKEKTMKISAKIYSNPNDITMKNSGTKTAGVDYLGEEIGKPIDGELSTLRENNNYQEEGISTDEQKKRKRSFREGYIKLFGKGMEELSKTKEGQAKLMEMWKNVHGCGHDVLTLVTNKKTGESKLHSPDHYCNPKPPFKVKYEGGKVIINLETDTDNYIQIDCKTELYSSPKLLFKHKVKSSK